IASMALSCSGGAPESEIVAALAHALKDFGRGCPAGEVPGTLDDALADLVQSTAKRLGGVRQALERRAWRLAYQPILRLADRAVHHHEALLRFNADELKNTGEVIELAERTGLIAQLDLAILDHA